MRRYANYPYLFASLDAYSHGQNVAILAHAITKEEAAVPPIDIERAISRKLLFEESPEVHTYTEGQEDGED